MLTHIRSRFSGVRGRCVVHDVIDHPIVVGCSTSYVVLRACIVVMGNRVAVVLVVLNRCLVERVMSHCFLISCAILYDGVLSQPAGGFGGSGDFGGSVLSTALNKLVS